MSNNTKLRGGAFLIALGCWLMQLAVAPIALSQSYELGWWKVSGGGGTSTGGGYSLSGTAGQPDAGKPMTGGEFSVTGGFWAVYAVQVIGAPTLGIFHTSTNTVVVYWPDPSVGWLLQQNPDLKTGIWANVGTPPTVVSGQKEVIISPLAGTGFYRLFHP